MEDRDNFYVTGAERIQHQSSITGIPHECNFYLCALIQFSIPPITSLSGVCALSPSRFLFGPPRILTGLVQCYGLQMIKIDVDVITITWLICSFINVLSQEFV